MESRWYLSVSNYLMHQGLDYAIQNANMTLNKGKKNHI